MPQAWPERPCGKLSQWLGKYLRPFSPRAIQMSTSQSGAPETRPMSAIHHG